MREPGFYTEEYHLLLLKAHQKEHLSGRGFRLWFALKGVNELAGCVSYSQIIYEPFLSCYLGYKTDADFCGRGLMTEAIRFSSERLFRDYKMHRIEAAVMPINSASKRVLEKCGFRYEGYSSKYLRIRGNWEDHERYALLAAEQE